MKNCVFWKLDSKISKYSMKNCVFCALGAKTTVFHWVFWYVWLSAQSEKAPGPSGQFQIAGKAGLARLAWLGWARQGCPDWAVWTGLAILSEESGSGKCPFQAALGWPGWVNTCPEVVSVPSRLGFAGQAEWTLMVNVPSRLGWAGQAEWTPVRWW